MHVPRSILPTLLAFLLIPNGGFFAFATLPDQPKEAKGPAGPAAPPAPAEQPAPAAPPAAAAGLAGFRTTIYDPHGHPVPAGALVLEEHPLLSMDKHLLTRATLYLVQGGLREALGYMTSEGAQVISIANGTKSKKVPGAKVEGISYKNVGMLLWENHLRHHRPRYVSVYVNGPASGGFHFSLGLRFKDEFMNFGSYYCVDDDALVDLLSQYHEAPTADLEGRILAHPEYQDIVKRLTKLTKGLWATYDPHRQLTQMEALSSRNKLNEFLGAHGCRYISFDGVMRFPETQAPFLKATFGVDY